MLCYLRHPGRPLKAGERPPEASGPSTALISTHLCGAFTQLCVAAVVSVHRRSRSFQQSALIRAGTLNCLTRPAPRTVAFT
jgi:hypothetical protein